MAKTASHIRVGCVFMRDELSKLSPYAQLTYFWLLSYSGSNPNKPCFPSQETLAKRMRVSRRTVVRAMDELENAKLIQRVAGNRDEHKKRFLCTEYYVHRSV